MRTVAAAEPLPNPNPQPSLVSESQSALSREWRRLTRVATLIAVLTSPSVFYWYHHHNGWSFFWSFVATAVNDLIACSWPLSVPMYWP